MEVCAGTGDLASDPAAVRAAVETLRRQSRASSVSARI